MIAFNMLKTSNLLPWGFTILLIIAGFSYSTFFTGTNSIYFAPALLSILAFGVFAMFPRIWTRVVIPKNGVALMLALYAAYIILSVSWSTVPYLSIQFMFFFCVVPFIFFVMMQTDDMLKWARIHSAAILTVFAGLAVWAMIQYFFFFEIYGKRIHHPMLNPNSLAGLFNMSLMAALALFVWAKKRTHMIAGFCLVMLLYAGLVVTQSRAGVVFEATSALVFFVVLWRYPSLTIKKLLLLAAAAILIPVLLDFVQTNALDKNFTKWTDDSTYKSMNDRYALIISTWEMIKDFPILGTGLSTFYFFYPRYRLPYDRSDGFFVHVDPMQFWAEMGVMAPILFYGVLIMVLLRTIKAVRSVPKDSDLRLEIMATFCALLAILMHAHMTFHLYILAMLFPIAFLFAYWYAATEKALGVDDRITVVYENRLNRNIVVFGILAILAFSAQWITRAAMGVSVTNKAAIALQRADYALAKDYLDQAAAIAPQNFYRLHQLQAGLVTNLLIRKEKALSLPEKKALYEEGIIHLDRAQKYAMPFEALKSERAKLYFMMPESVVPDGDAKAEVLLLSALENNPMLWDARVGLSRIYKKQGYLKKAVQVLEDGRKWPMPKGPYMVSVLAEMGGIYHRLGDQKNANRLMNEALYWRNRYGGGR
jgi:putative inorganic carbon (HCO3(-)) transporter